MARSSCTSCGLRSQHCQCLREASTAGIVNGNAGERAFKLTPVTFWIIYLVFTFAVMGVISLFSFVMHAVLLRGGPCYLEVFVDSFSVSNVSTATADWNVGFAAKSTGNGCKVSLHTIKSRLLRGEKLIAESKTPDFFGRLVTGKIYESGSYAIFKTVETPESLDGVVIWDLRVEVMFRVTIKGSSDNDDGFLIVTCGDIPVNFTVDPAGDVKGTLLGNMRPCEYLFREYKDTSF